MKIMRFAKHEDARAKMVDLTQHDDETLDAAAGMGVL